MEEVSSDDSGPPSTDRDQLADGEAAESTEGAESSEEPEVDEQPPRECNDPVFDVPNRPQRRYTRFGGVEYEGRAVFHLEPTRDLSADELDALFGDVVEGNRYVPCDWFDFPRPVYLVHDREVSTTFRVVVRTGRLELHALPSTEPQGLRALYDGVVEATDHGWSVRRVVEPSV